MSRHKGTNVPEQPTVPPMPMLIREREIPIELINDIGIRSIEIEQARVLLDRMMGEIKPGQEYRIRYDERISEDPATMSVKMCGSLQIEEEDNGQLWVPCASDIMPKTGEIVLVTDTEGSQQIQGAEVQTRRSCEVERIQLDMVYDETISGPEERARHQGKAHRQEERICTR